MATSRSIQCRITRGVSRLQEKEIFRRHLLVILSSKRPKNAISSVQEKENIENQKHFAVSTSTSISNNKTACTPIMGSRSNLVDFSNSDGNIDDASLTRVPAELLDSFNYFNNCTNCHFTLCTHTSKMNT